MTKIIKKDNDIKWNDANLESFNRIRKALTKDPILASPDYTK